MLLDFVYALRVVATGENLSCLVDACKNAELTICSTGKNCLWVEVSGVPEYEVVNAFKQKVAPYLNEAAFLFEGL